MPNYSLEAAEQIDDWKNLETKITDGFSFYLATYSEEIMDYQPKGSDGFQAGSKYIWQFWEEPSYKLRYKKSYGVLKDYFGNIVVIKD
jgi:hypothetical protein